MPIDESSLKSRVAEVEERIRTAAGKVGRPREDITLVAVTKKFSAQTIREGYSAGLREFGENYVQEFAQKKPQVSDLEGVRFHLIGHLQSNKARLAVDLFQVIQTVDSVKLLRRLDAMAEERGDALEATIEVKLANEQSKTGAQEGELAELAGSVKECKFIRVTGLMTVPPWSKDPEISRPFFRRLASLAREHGFKQLSMGMSNDFEVAIEEGATMVRLGTALFGARPKA